MSGVGSLSKEFKGTDITVNPDNGYMMRNGSYLPVYDTAYDEKKGEKKTGVYQQFYYDAASGKTYMSQYNKTMRKFYAESYSTSDGKMYKANGKEATAKDSSSVWENVSLSFDWAQKIIDWILSFFRANTTLSAENTLPNQKADGFVTESGFGEAGTILLLLAAGGVLVAGGFGKKGKKTSK